MFLRLLGVLGFVVVAAVIAIAASMSRGQSPARTDDASLAQQINSRMHADADLGAVDVRAEVDHGVAILTGTVWTHVQRDRAEKLAQMTGVARVDNRITVDRSTSSAPATRSLT